ncbi:hypothetical protein AMTR_s00037p00218880 [Amborella trichopoda]|uniref:Uncharacterized protein n=1 Tax=Amborella trichopoda TaxID=13333 RepID=U5D597_AMBTC|nr:hypothetical protein AMTR_s00037p00218880 [Amborella trichopoda]
MPGNEGVSVDIELVLELEASPSDFEIPSLKMATPPPPLGTLLVATLANDLVCFAYIFSLPFALPLRCPPEASDFLATK